MAHAKSTDHHILEKAAAVFRSYGYEGTSLSRLADAAGIEKASLYYRFPGGKDEIALAVAAHVSSWFGENVLAPLQQPGPPIRRLQAAIRKLREFYRDGAMPCMLDTLSLPGGNKPLAAALRGSLNGMLQGFAAIAQDSGVTPGLALRRAEQAVVNIEGSLVLARVSSDRKPFLRALAGLVPLLTAKQRLPTPAK